MDLALTLTLVGAAALYLGARTWRMFRPRSGAAGGCGCASAKAGCPATASNRWRSGAARIRSAARAAATPRV